MCRRTYSTSCVLIIFLFFFVYMWYAIQYTSVIQMAKVSARMKEKKGTHILSIYPPRHFPQRTKKIKKSVSREKRKKGEEQRTKFAATYWRRACEWKSEHIIVKKRVVCVMRRKEKIPATYWRRPYEWKSEHIIV